MLQEIQFVPCLNREDLDRLVQAARYSLLSPQQPTDDAKQLYAQLMDRQPTIEAANQMYPLLKLSRFAPSQFLRITPEGQKQILVVPDVPGGKELTGSIARTLLVGKLAAQMQGSEETPETLASFLRHFSLPMLELHFYGEMLTRAWHLWRYHEGSFFPDFLSNFLEPISRGAVSQLPEVRDSYIITWDELKTHSLKHYDLNPDIFDQSTSIRGHEFPKFNSADGRGYVYRRILDGLVGGARFYTEAKVLLTAKDSEVVFLESSPGDGRLPFKYKMSVESNYYPEKAMRMVTASASYSDPVREASRPNPLKT